MKSRYAYAFSLAALAGCAKQETNIKVLSAAQAGTDKPVVMVCEEFLDPSAKNPSIMKTGSVMFLGRTVRGTADGETTEGSNRSCTVAFNSEKQVTCSVGAFDSYQHIATFKATELTMSAGRQAGEPETTIENAAEPSLSYKTAGGEPIKVKALFHTTKEGETRLVPGLQKFAECRY